MKIDFTLMAFREESGEIVVLRNKYRGEELLAMKKVLRVSVDEADNLVKQLSAAIHEEAK
jgi:hypothetical protein